MKKRLLSIVLVVVMVASMLMGCGGDANTSSDAGAEKQLAVQIGPDPETIDPALNSSSDGGNMILHLFEGLFLKRHERL